ncbi:MAG: hypothetical protein ACO4CW_13210, partial [Planctomycetota bacterium]
MPRATFVFTPGERASPPADDSSVSCTRVRETVFSGSMRVVRSWLRREVTSGFTTTLKAVGAKESSRTPVTSASYCPFSLESRPREPFAEVSR